MTTTIQVPNAEKEPTAKNSSPVRSMTGFARTQHRVSDQMGFTLTLKSVNHRFLDLQMHLPSIFDAVEIPLRNALKAKLVRGHVELRIALDRTTASGFEYNTSLIEAYIAAFRQASKTHHVAGEPDLNAAFRLPGAFAAETSLPENETRELEASVLTAIHQTIEELNAMRTAEGGALIRVLESSMGRLQAAVSEVGTLRDGVQAAHYERLRLRISELITTPVEPERLLTEAALMAERSDVEEETVRLQTHIGHFRSLLADGGELGKKLDFLLQEMNREANTMLSKTSGVAGNGLRITELGLVIKAEIEKAREQVQNLE
jgi:uncharacterized protein (TIGR00255 family)